MVATRAHIGAKHEEVALRTAQDLAAQTQTVGATRPWHCHLDRSASSVFATADAGKGGYRTGASRSRFIALCASTVVILHAPVPVLFLLVLLSALVASRFKAGFSVFRQVDSALYAFGVLFAHSGR